MALQHWKEAEFEACVQSGALAMVDFFATWCGPCKMLSPVVEELAAAYDGRVVTAKVDVDEAQALAMACRVMSVPTVLFLKDGKELARLVGVHPREDYEAVLEENL